MDKKIVARIRRSVRVRRRLYYSKYPRLVVHRTSRHIYAQVISKDKLNVFSAASTLEKNIVAQLQSKITSNKLAAAIVGKIIAERTIRQGIKIVSFDRSGFKYHGRIQCLAEAARCSGLQF